MPFSAHSNQKLRPRDDVWVEIERALKQGKQSGQQVVLVLNGWDGLSPHAILFVNLRRPLVVYAFPHIIRGPRVQDVIRGLPVERENEADNELEIRRITGPLHESSVHSSEVQKTSIVIPRTQVFEPSTSETQSRMSV